MDEKMKESDLKTIIELAMRLRDLRRERDRVIAQIKSWAENQDTPDASPSAAARPQSCCPSNPPSPTVSACECAPAPVGDKSADEPTTRGVRMCWNDGKDIVIRYCENNYVFIGAASRFPSLAETIRAAIDNACAAERERTALFEKGQA